MSKSSRRVFLRCLMTGLGAMALWPERLWAAGKRLLLSPDVSMGSLINKDPSVLDPSQLPLTPVKLFGTMGTTKAGHHKGAWRLSLVGLIGKPLELTYEQMTALPKLEKRALLICPGFFAYYANWTGFSLGALLRQAGLDPKARWVDIEGGPPDDLNKQEHFELKDVLADKVFLAYAVNGEKLPEKHGFPLRTVVIDEYGGTWVKYVQKITVAA